MKFILVLMTWHNFSTIYILMYVYMYIVFINNGEHFSKLNNE